MDDDQYDFHGYNLRKFNINTYLRYLSCFPEFSPFSHFPSLLKWEDRLRSHPLYVNTAIYASRVCYFAIQL